KVIKSSFSVHRRKGTIGALKRAISAIWDNLEVKEWFEYNGNRYNFKGSVISTGGFDYSKIDQAIEIMNTSKNVRSKLEGIDITLTQKDNTPYIASALLTQSQTTVLPPIDTEVEQVNPVYVAAFASSISYITILPQGE
ncbi:MAG: phage tail protein, partial [Lentisphaeraceae bacterium]|nr:phage tail protein [Lentisphaeraceae bacterium]